MPSWKDRVGPQIVERAETAVSATGVQVDSVSFDFTNCAVRVGVPEALNDNDRDAVVVAARDAAGIGAYAADPPEYPFTVHLQRPKRPVLPPSIQDGVLEFRLRASDLTNLRDAYAELGRRCGAAPVVATFALGGLVPLQFITRLDRSKYSSTEDFLVALSSLQAKYHLFPGLLWTEDNANAEAFQRWLSGLGDIEELVVFDTTFSGGAVGRIANVINAWAPQATSPVPRRITIIGVADEGRLNGATLKDGEQQLTTADGTTIPMRTEFLRAASLVAEDVNELVGYDALRSVGEIEATWTSAVVRVEGDDGATFDVIGTRTLPATFADLLDGRFRTSVLDREFAALTTAFGVLMCIRQAAAKERDELSRAWAARLLSDQEFRDECGRVKRAEDGALRRYKRFFDAL